MADNWLIQDIWNETFIEEVEEDHRRDYIRGSDIGKPFLDRYYAMTGEPWTNHFDARILRIFEAGNLYEWLVRLVLIRAGIMQSTQDEIRIMGEDHLDVVGHLDFIAGGTPNWEAAEAIVPMLEQLYFPNRMLKISEKLIERVQKMYPNGMDLAILDVKSINSMVFWRHMDKDKGNQPLMEAYDHHVLQLYTYMKGKHINNGRLLYISKDDLTLAEVEVRYDEDLEKRWRTDVQQMSHYYRNKIVPPRDPDFIWDANKKKIKMNWKVQRSNYLERITGMKKEYYDDVMKKLESRVNYRITKSLKEKPDEDPRVTAYPYLKVELEKIYADPTGSLPKKVEIKSG